MSSDRRRLGVAAAGLALAVAVAASGGAATYAAFSDFDAVEDNEVVAATVKVGLPGPGADLAFTGLVPGVAKSEVLSIAYRGTIPGSLALQFRPDGGNSFCRTLPDGSHVARDGGALEVSFGGGWIGYCPLLDDAHVVPVSASVAPGEDVAVPVSVRLAPGTDHRYSELADVDRLTARATQLGGGAFTDFALGTITLGASTILPPIPAECGPVGNYQSIVKGTEGDDVIDAGNGKQIVLGFGGNDVLDGGNGKDCLVGGDGDDLLEGGNGKDVMVGGAGFDTCNGGHAPDTYSCEAPSEISPPAPLLLGPAAAAQSPPAVAPSPPPPTGPVDPDVDEADEIHEDSGVEQPEDPGPTEPEEPTPPAEVPEPPGDGTP